MEKLPNVPKVDRSAGSFKFGVFAGLGALLVVLLVMAVLQTATVVTTVIAATFFAIGLNRPVLWLRGHGMSRTLATLALLITFLLAGAGIAMLLVPTLVEQITALLNTVPGLVDKLTAGDSWQSLTHNQQITEWAKSLFTPANLGMVAGGLLGGVVNVVSGIAVFITGFLLTFFILAAYDRLREGAYRMIPRSRRSRMMPLIDEVLTKVGAYLVGAIGIAAIAGTTSLIFMLIAGIPYALLLAIIVAILDTIPQIGATLGATVVVAVSLGGGVWLALSTVAFFVVYQQIENWIIYPRVMNKAVKISNLAAIVSVLIGFALFGVLGVLIAVPGYAAAQLLVRELFLPRQEQR